MANRYWVGGAAAWNNTAGTKWALTSGGTGGEAVPTSADDVFFDANSGGVQVYVESTTHVTANNLNFTGFTGEFTKASGATAIVALWGNLTLSSTMNLTYDYQFNFQNESNGTQNITSNGIPIRATIFLTTNGASESTHQVVPVGALKCNGIGLRKGHFNNSNNVDVDLVSLFTYNSVGTYNKTISFGNSTWNFVDDRFNATNPVYMETSGLTVNCGTSLLKFKNRLTTAGGFAGGGKTYYDLELDGGCLSVGDSNTFNKLTIGSGSKVLDSYPIANMQGSWYDSPEIMFGQSFQPNATTKLKCLRVAAINVGSPTGTMVAKLYAHTGTFGSTGIPTGSPLATSDSIDVTTISNKMINYNVEFNFSGANQVLLTSGTSYFICIDRAEPSAPTNYVKFYTDTTSPTASGNFAYTTDGTNWTYTTAHDLIYYIYGLGGSFAVSNGSTQTISNIESKGTSDYLATIKSFLDGSAFTLSDSSGTNNVINMSIRDCTATGGAIWNAVDSLNVSGNTGWNFQSGKFIQFL